MDLYVYPIGKTTYNYRMQRGKCLDKSLANGIAVGGTASGPYHAYNSAVSKVKIPPCKQEYWAITTMLEIFGICSILKGNAIQVVLGNKA